MPSPTDSPEPSGRREIDRRALTRIVRSAALSCYGVTDVVDPGVLGRLARRLGLQGGVRVDYDPLRVEMNLDLSPNLPREQVLANVRDAVAYAVQRDMGQPVEQLTLTIDGR